MPSIYLVLRSIVPPPMTTEVAANAVPNNLNINNELTSQRGFLHHWPSNPFYSFYYCDSGANYEISEYGKYIDDFNILKIAFDTIQSKIYQDKEYALSIYKKYHYPLLINICEKAWACNDAFISQDPQDILFGNTQL